MTQTAFLKVRVSSEEMFEIERQARAMSTSKSALVRLILTGGASQIAQQQSPAAGIESLQKVIGEQQRDIAEMRDALQQSAAAFDALLNQLNEFLRVPTFREYRSRLAAEGIEKRQNETEQDFLTRCANRYFVAYQAWPDASNLKTFGIGGAGVDLAKFPKQPPA